MSEKYEPYSREDYDIGYGEGYAAARDYVFKMIDEMIASKEAELEALKAKMGETKNG